MRKRSRAAGLELWSKSSEFRQIARKSAKANLATFRKAPRCGATRKRDGAPCCNAGMKNGRCGIHGGKTPSGRQWHVVQFPDCSTPAGEAKFNRKLRDRERIARKRAARLAAMTPEQRARHDAWHQTHKPGSEARRLAEREERRQTTWLRSLLNREVSLSTTDPELARIDARLAELRALQTCNGVTDDKTDAPNEGIFA